MASGWDALLAFVSVVVDVFVVAGAAWPYIPQARALWRTKEPEAFSLLTSLVQIVSATLRVFYWLEQRFEAALLLQACVAIVAQLAMVLIVVRVRAFRRSEAVQLATSGGSPPPTYRVATFTDLDWRSFWAWDDWASYVQFEVLLVMALLLLQAAFGRMPWFVQVQGALALGIEALLPLPQAMRNYRNKSTHGLSAVLVFSWLFGDSFKVGYALIKRQPLPFVLCGSFQICVDVVIAAQMAWCYRGRLGQQPGATDGTQREEEVELARSSPDAGDRGSGGGQASLEGFGGDDADARDGRGHTTAAMSGSISSAVGIAAVVAGGDKEKRTPAATPTAAEALASCSSGAVAGAAAAAPGSDAGLCVNGRAEPLRNGRHVPPEGCTMARCKEATIPLEARLGGSQVASVFFRISKGVHDSFVSSRRVISAAAHEAASVAVGFRQ